jgi:uncharacterized protein YlxW (UPF0749 family)
MTELETKLISLLKASEVESKERENRLLGQVSSLQQQVETSAQQVQTLSGQVTSLAKAYERLADLWNEEWKS